MLVDALLLLTDDSPFLFLGPSTVMTISMVESSSSSDDWTFFIDDDNDMSSSSSSLISGMVSQFFSGNFCQQNGDASSSDIVVFFEVEGGVIKIVGKFFSLILNVLSFVSCKTI